MLTSACMTTFSSKKLMRNLERYWCLWRTMWSNSTIFTCWRYLMIPWQRNAICITGHLWRESIGHNWTITRIFDFFYNQPGGKICWTNSRVAGDLRSHDAHVTSLQCTTCACTSQISAVIPTRCQMTTRGDRNEWRHVNKKLVSGQQRSSHVLKIKSSLFITR